MVGISWILYTKYHSKPVALISYSLGTHMHALGKSDRQFGIIFLAGINMPLLEFPNKEILIKHDKKEIKSGNLKR